jgi:predicted nucleic acid-binding protein
MTVVSNTSPLNYLVLIDAVGVLPTLFGRVIVPPAVLAELQHPSAPEAVRTWVRLHPPWLEVRSVTQPLAPIRLGLGELEAVTLARELSADKILLDDRRGRKLAADVGLTVVGTVAVLFEAGERGLLNLAEAMARLAATTFRIHPSVLSSLRQT